jgi:hypothetical protein
VFLFFEIEVDRQSAKVHALICFQLFLPLHCFAEAGVVGGCAEACKRIPGPDFAQAACQMLCDYVGVMGFRNLIEM